MAIFSPITRTVLHTATSGTKALQSTLFGNKPKFSHQRGCSSVDRVLASEAKGRGFDPRQPRQWRKSYRRSCGVVPDAKNSRKVVSAEKAAIIANSLEGCPSG